MNHITPSSITHVTVALDSLVAATNVDSPLVAEVLVDTAIERLKAALVELGKTGTARDVVERAQALRAKQL